MTTSVPTSALPDCFIAAWERHELVVDAVERADAGPAIWVQTPTWFVDVRGPGGFASDTSFAGTTAWDAPYLAWAHPIDLGRPAGVVDDGADCGHITLADDDLIETGEHIAGVHATYRERWCRLAGARGPVLAAQSEHGLAVRVGDHAAAVVDQRAVGGGAIARYERFEAGRWVVAIELRRDAADERSVSTPTLPAPLGTEHSLLAGWEWCCPT